MKPRPKTRTSEALHREVFAAAYLHDVLRTIDLYDSGTCLTPSDAAGIHPTDPKWRGSLDSALETVTGERAMVIADKAVEEYKRCRRGL